MATSRLCCSSSSSSLLLPRASSSHSHRPAASSFVRVPSLSNGIHRFGGRTTTPLHIAHAKIAKGPERKGVTTSAPEPEMTPEEKKAYDEVSASLEGINTDFWEGPQFNALGFTIQYLWVFGIVVSVSELRNSIPSWSLWLSWCEFLTVWKLRWGLHLPFSIWKMFCLNSWPRSRGEESNHCVFVTWMSVVNQGFRDLWSFNIVRFVDSGGVVAKLVRKTVNRWYELLY